MTDFSQRRGSADQAHFRSEAMNRPGAGLWRIKAWSAARLAAVLAAAIPGGAALAQTVNVAPPPEKFAVAPGGVDMRSGRYVYNQTDLSIGGGALALTRSMTQQVAGHTNPFANFSHNWDVLVSEKRINMTTGIFRHTPGQPDYQIEIAFGGRSQTFRAYSSAAFDPTSRAGYARISHSGAATDRASAAIVYTFISGDGTTAVFRPLGSADCSSMLRCAYVSSITDPDGMVTSFEYEVTGGANSTRLRSVVNSRGYGLLFEYSGGLVTKACVLNLAYTAKPASNNCPAGAPASLYTYDNAGGAVRLATATDPGGATSSFINGANTIGFVKPGQAAPWLTNSFQDRTNDDWQVEQIVGSQAFADGTSYAYSFDLTPPITDHISSIAGGYFVDGAGNRTTLRYDFPYKPHGQSGYGDVGGGTIGEPSSPLVQDVTPGPVEVTDPLGRVTTNDYCDPYAAANLPSWEHHRCVLMPLAVSSTDPEGIQTKLSWDFASRNLLQSRQIAKVGSGLTDIVRSATYNCGGPTVRYCNKPVSVTDANGNVSQFTYSADHGGVLTETSPPVNGISAQKRYSYAQRYAWVSNGSGGYVQGSAPVWLLTQMRFCKTGAASGAGCAIAGDEVVTTYDYGPDSGPNNLLLRGTVVSADGTSLRTCYGYDPQARKISETAPAANLAVCS
jgi:hypothetical protein